MLTRFSYVFRIPFPYIFLSTLKDAMVKIREETAMIYPIDNAGVFTRKLLKEELLSLVSKIKARCYFISNNFEVISGETETTQESCFCVAEQMDGSLISFRVSLRNKQPLIIYKYF